MDALVKCPCCGTEYFEAIPECDWCVDVKPQPLEKQTEQA